MKNIKIWLPSIGILLLFVLVMTSGSYLKKPITGNDDVIANIEALEQAVKQGNWVQTNKKTEQSVATWEKVKKRIQFSVERDFILEIDNKFATIKGAAKVKDDKLIITTVEEMMFLWNELGR